MSVLKVFSKNTTLGWDFFLITSLFFFSVLHFPLCGSDIVVLYN